MEIPKPPEDFELRNIIDKLANFVARNGLEFENMTKNKQKDNPKFSFLFGGEFYRYYQYKLTSEQQGLNQQMSAQNVQETILQQTIQNAPWQQSYPPYNQPPPHPQNSMLPPWQQQQPPPPQPQSLPIGQQPPYMQSSPMNNQMPPMQSMNANIMPPANQPLQPLMMMHPMQPTGMLKEEKELEHEEKNTEQKISESENNLKQQYESLMIQQHEQIEKAVSEAEEAERTTRADKLKLKLSSLDQILQPIIDSCTKDSIASGKSWIISHSTTAEHCILIARQLLYRVVSAEKMGNANEKSFNRQLHLVYLINDVLHHASRKNNSQLQYALEQVIVPIFCITHISAKGQEKERDRLSKLLGLWNKFQYFSLDTMNKLKDPEPSLEGYKAQRLKIHATIAEKVKSSIEEQYKQYERQHQEYADHIKRQVADKRKAFEERKKIEEERRKKEEQEAYNQQQKDEKIEEHYQSDQGYQVSEPNLQASSQAPPPWSQHGSNHQQPASRENDVREERDDRYDRHQPANYQSMRDDYHDSDYRDSRNQESSGGYRNRQPLSRQQEDDWRGGSDNNEKWNSGNTASKDSGDWNKPPQHMQSSMPHRNAPPQGQFDRSRGGGWMRGGGRGPPGPNDARMPGPPHRGMMGPTPDENLKPKAPYFDLPAGLMAPLVKLEDMEYKELDPSLIRLPPCIPPSERLMAAVDAFYKGPSHDHPRNPDGWETNGLFEFFRAKVRAKRAKDNKMRESRSRSKSLSRSRSRSSSRSRSRSYSRSRSRSQSRSRSRSYTPPSSKQDSRRKSQSRTPPQTWSPKRDRRDSIGGREATPPRAQLGGGMRLGLGGDLQQVNKSDVPNQRLSHDNPGAMMMKRMGWQGAGLGSKEQGIQDPVQAGEVRDNYDKFRGLGNDLKDPFENFRKSRSQGYNNRLRKR